MNLYKEFLRIKNQNGNWSDLDTQLLIFFLDSILEKQDRMHEELKLTLNQIKNMQNKIEAYTQQFMRVRWTTTTSKRTGKNAKKS